MEKRRSKSLRQISAMRSTQFSSPSLNSNLRIRTGSVSAFRSSSTSNFAVQDVKRQNVQTKKDLISF